jgi:GNAT superfamily N-acetyltransferase
LTAAIRSDVIETCLPPSSSPPIPPVSTAIACTVGSPMSRTGRPGARATHDAAVDGSRNYGVYDTATGEQLAYARVITDGVTFAWLCDVFVASEARGRGIGVALITGVVDALAPLDLKRIALTTADAHGLYEKFGFRPLDQPEQWMARTGAATR